MVNTTPLGSDDGITPGPVQSASDAVEYVEEDFAMISEEEEEPLPDGQDGDVAMEVDNEVTGDGDGNEDGSVSVEENNEGGNEDEGAETAPGEENTFVHDLEQALVQLLTGTTPTTGASNGNSDDVRARAKAAAHFVSGNPGTACASSASGHYEAARMNYAESPPYPEWNLNRGDKHDLDWKPSNDGQSVGASTSQSEPRRSSRINNYGIVQVEEGEVIDVDAVAAVDEKDVNGELLENPMEDSSEEDEEDSN